MLAARDRVIFHLLDAQIVSVSDLGELVKPRSACIAAVSVPGY